MNPNRRTPVTPTLRGIGLATACAVTLTVGACTDKPAGDADQPGDLAGQTVTVAAVWTGAEQQNFRKVLDAFAEKTGATVKFTPTGDNVSTFLDSKIQGGDPPDVAMLPQQGALVQFAKAGHLKPANQEVQKAIDANFAPIWRTLGSVDSKLYGVYFKAANKSTVWYRTKAFEDAGVRAAEDLGRVRHGREGRLGRGNAGTRRRRRGRLDAHRLVRERLPLPGRPGAVRQAVAARDPLDPPVRDQGADHARRALEHPGHRRGRPSAGACRRTSRPRSATRSPPSRRRRWCTRATSSPG